MRISVVGLGKLGLPLAETLALPHEVSGFDLAERTSQTVRIASSLADACADAELVLLVLPTPHQAAYDGWAAVGPAGTWMARMLAEGRGAGVTFDRPDAESVTRAVRMALSRLAELRMRADAAVGPWRATQNVGLYFDRLADDLVVSASPGF